MAIPITLIQTATDIYVNDTLAFPSNNTLGNMLICVANINAPSFTISDTAGNNWILFQSVTGINTSVTNGGNIALWYCPYCVGGANSVTVGGPGSVSGHTSFTIAEFNGVNTLDQTGSGSYSGASSTWTSNAITTAYSQELVIGLISGNYQTGSLAVNAPFTTLGSGTHADFLSFYEIVTSPQTALTATGTLPSSATNSGAYSLSSFYLQPPELLLLGCGDPN
jgi:hypothetical protein